MDAVTARSRDNVAVPDAWPRVLLIVSHVVHYRMGDRLFAYGPYAREIDLWADLFPRVVIAAPCRDAHPDGDCAAFTRPNIVIRPQREMGGQTLGARIAQLLAVPQLLWSLSRAMRAADAIHVRCPGNLGLLGVGLAPLFSRFLVAKYAGQWSGGPWETWAVRLQRALLRSLWWRGPVTVYGRWPNQPDHVVPFFTSGLSAVQMQRARASSATKRLGLPLQVLYVGRLSEAKNVDVLLRAIASLRARGVAVECTIVGGGPERTALERLADDLGIREATTFAGAVPLDQVVTFYERGHVLVLASESEGWPKAITEAMAFGLVCIGSNRGLMVDMLGEGRGIVVGPRDVAALDEALGAIAARPSAYAGMRACAAAWAQQRSLEDLRDALRELLGRWWGVGDPPYATAHREVAGALP